MPVDAPADRVVRSAGQLARDHVAARRVDFGRGFDPLVAAIGQQLREVFEGLDEPAGLAARDSRAAEWLADNEYVVRGALEAARDVLTRAFHRDLPKLISTEESGIARVQALAKAVVEHLGDQVQFEECERFLAEYQTVRPLGIGELWAFPAVLRLVVLESLVEEVRAALDSEPSEQEASPHWITIANCIGSLRLIDGNDWSRFVERVSLVERSLRTDPSDHYAAMDFESRDRYRRAVEEIARWSGEEETAVADGAIELARSASTGERDGNGAVGTHTTHVGFYLVDAGRETLEARFRTKPRGRAARERWIRRHAKGLYFGGTAFLALATLFALGAAVLPRTGWLWPSAFILLVGLVPALTIAGSLINWLTSQLLSPTRLAKLEIKQRVPEKLATVIAVPALIGDAREVDELVGRLRVLYESTELENLRFLLLTDFHDASSEHLPGDAALVERLQQHIRDLNDRHRDGTPGPFGWLHRPRRYNEAQACWMGWERKRGKLQDLNQLILGADAGAFTIREGCVDDLARTRFVLTLDADTGLPRGTANQLIGALGHPLNSPVVSEGGVVDRGYSVLQPRLETLADGDSLTKFGRLGGSGSGLDLYSNAISDGYQDLFAQGIYAGKGVYDVAAFEASLRDRVPDDTLLSHDLFEGVHGRAGLVSDAILLEEFPGQVIGYARRMHRWIRGDWQIAPWLLPRVRLSTGTRTRNRLDAISRWKIFDNLRRSLLAPSLLTLVIGGWLFRIGPPIGWAVFLALVLGFPAFLGAATATRRVIRQGRVAQGRSLLKPTRGTWVGLSGNLARWLLAILLLPFDAFVSLDAIIRTLWRVVVSRRRLLEWTSAAATARSLETSAGARSHWREMAPAPVTAAIAAGALGASSAAPAVGWVLLLGWFVSPQVAAWIGQPVLRGRAHVSADSRRFLRLTALRTWLYFERFVTADDHWLPPDNWQEDRNPKLARRTSPTNIGMLFTSMVAAYDLGYLNVRSLEAMARDSLASTARLERYRGHILNWYATDDLSPLEPRYVSTVDSGNLAMSLLLLRRTLLDGVTAPPLRSADADGLADMFRAVEASVAALPVGEEAKLELLAALERGVLKANRLTPHAGERHRALLELESRILPEVGEMCVAVAEEPGLAPRAIAGLREWSTRLHQQVATIRQDLLAHAPWLPLLNEVPRFVLEAGSTSPAGHAWEALARLLNKPPSPGDAAVWYEDTNRTLDEFRELSRAENWSDRVRAELRSVRRDSKRIRAELQDVSEQAARMVGQMDFHFLFDRSRQLLHIGYNLTDEELDPHYYDLLASEARVASYVGIAKGELPATHWLRLGRSYTMLERSPVLLSWGATMFEYLLPRLFLGGPPGSLLEHSCQQAVRGQIAFGRRNGIAWGISESAYERKGDESSYRYRAFGVPGFGLRRDLGERWVVAPYASALALSYDPVAAIQNLKRLVAEGLEGPYGFYEAIDYGRPPTERAQKPARPGRVVRAFMAHHQGMVLAAIDNVLNEDILVRRLRGEPQVAAVDYLLHERLPWRVPLEKKWESTVATATRPVPDAGAAERMASWTPVGDEAVPQIHALSNGRYRVVLSARGGGGSFWRDRALTRWQSDPTLETHGTWTYIVDRDSGAAWSTTAAPIGGPMETADVHFSAHAAEFFKREHQVSSRLRVTVPPDDDAEIRALTLTNEGDQTRRLAVVTYAEVILSTPEEDARHPAYNELFLEGSIADSGALVYRRRPKSDDERPLFWAHALAGGSGVVTQTDWEFDRLRFLGRGGSVRAPAMLDLSSADGSARPGAPAGRRPGEDGAPQHPLHPIASITVELELAPYATRELVAVTAAGDDRAGVLSCLEEYGVPARAAWAAEHAQQTAEIALQKRGLRASDVAEFERLLSAALHPGPGLRLGPAERRDRARPQSDLWRFGISGDHPIILLRVRTPEATDIARRLLTAHEVWRSRGFTVDLVILDVASGGYAQPLRDALSSEVERTRGSDWIGRNGGIHILSGELSESNQISGIEAAAVVVLDSRAGSLKRQLDTLPSAVPLMPDFVPTPSSPPAIEETEALERPNDLSFDNGLAGFSADGSEYVIFLEPGQTTPSPWSNVIAQPNAGCICTESGLGYTWVANSGENRLTPWRCDPVGDAPSEVVYLRDEETGEVWSPTPQPAGAAAPYEIRHGAGYTTYLHRSHGLEQRSRVFCDPEDPVKLVAVRLTNLTSRERRITATFYAELVLGLHRSRSARHILTDYEPEVRAIFARNPFSEDFSARVAFLTASQEPHGITTDRLEFLGRDGGLDAPDALRRIGLSGRASAEGDPCGAVQVHLDIGPGETRKFHFALGEGESRDDSVRLARRFGRAKIARQSWERVHRFWNETLGKIVVRTPDPAFDLMMNRWLPYQIRTSRLWGRTGFHQSSGAFGYRDQLQDVLALVDTDPRLARAHILEAARHQFVQGDVLHWWHPVSETGVRTRCSDDLVWLPYVTAAYALRADDAAILDEPVHFLEAEPLADEEHDRFGRFPRTQFRETLYEHCARALERASGLGAHGLPLIGSYDWNDGLDRVGAEGRGESVWLGWFLIATLRGFITLAEDRADHERARQFRAQVEGLETRIDEAAWDGEWYRRAYYDDGAPLGSAKNLEGQIDVVSQAWSVISGGGTPARQRRAMRSVDRMLHDPEARILRLLTPPFDHTGRDPGYIKGYPPGVRENGAQYSHAAVWAGWAYSMLGDADRALEIFHMVSPARRAGTKDGIETYRAEPYVVAADIYSGAAFAGRGGWTWYTGAAAWLYRLGLERILGLQKRGEEIGVEPGVPHEWTDYEFALRIGRRVRRVRVERAAGSRKHVASIDGRVIARSDPATREP